MQNKLSPLSLRQFSSSSVHPAVHHLRTDRSNSFSRIDLRHRSAASVSAADVILAAYGVEFPDLMTVGFVRGGEGCVVAMVAALDVVVDDECTGCYELPSVKGGMLTPIGVAKWGS